MVSGGLDVISFCSRCLIFWRSVWIVVSMDDDSRVVEWWWKGG